MEFNRNLPNIVHLDINSCFATIEQQANPLLRDKTVVVAAYMSPSSCILASSVTAKRNGIKTGMRVSDALKIDPKVVVLLPDPFKYRFVHKQIFKIIKRYSDKIIPKSIDEFVFSLPFGIDPKKISIEIKKKIKEEIGEYITVSIGISTNSYLAKIASNFEKPDGLTLIDNSNYLNIFSKLKLTDLTGIKKGNESRLKIIGVKSVIDFYNSSIQKLKIAFQGINGYYWFLKIHGYDVEPLLNSSFNYTNKRKSCGNSYAPPKLFSNLPLPIISKLCQKTGYRLRKYHLKALGVNIFLQDRNGKTWYMSKKSKKEIISDKDLYLEIKDLFDLSPIKDNIRNIAISTFNLRKINLLQTNIFEDIDKKVNLTKAIDSINNKWGLFTIRMGLTNTDAKVVQDRISFGQL